ncbi:MAG: site-specific integrase, partial [Acidobacteriales bacterium]|nr:site-specific integrase [Terriglobales bacterium]
VRPLRRDWKQGLSALTSICWQQPCKIRVTLQPQLAPTNALAHAFGCWLQQKHQLDEISELMLERYLDDLSSQKESPSPKQRQKITAAIHLLLKHSRHAGLIALPSAESFPVTEVQQWLTRYEEHLEKVLGLAPGSRQQYLRFAARLLKAMSERGVIEWSAFTADKIAAFLQAEAAPRKGAGPHAPATALRSFLRFLVSQGRLSAGLELAIPPIRRWSQSALPQRLSETEINRLLTFCADQTATGRRNYAMLLLLSRLGLRAKEVARLQLNDIDWINGSLLARSSKTHCQRLLPLPQDVGEALLSYLRNGRPQTTDREVFLTALAPYHPLKTSAAISVTVKRLLARAGIKRQSGGAHLLRHTAATQMVNRGASFKDVADVLGHQQLQTTGIYAKLDLAALSEVALPWPGGAQ